MKTQALCYEGQFCANVRMLAEQRMLRTAAVAQGSPVTRDQMTRPKPAEPTPTVSMDFSRKDADFSATNYFMLQSIGVF